MSITIKETQDLKQFKLSEEIQKNQFLMHTSSWQEFIHSSFNNNQDSNIMKQSFIIAVKGKIIQTLLPITKIKSPIFKNRIISSAYQEYGGFAGEKSNQKEILTFIQKKYQDEFDFLEIRGAIDQNNNPEELASNSTIIKKIHQNRFILTLENKNIDQIKSNIQKAKRKAIKKAQKEITCKDINLLNKKELSQFYKLYLQNMRAFGSPAYSKQYFKEWAKAIQKTKQGKVLGCYKKETLISALFGFTYSKKVHITIAISNPKFKQHRPSDLMHWEFIKWAKKNDYKQFDFGLARNESGQFRYKQKWGTIMFDLPTYYLKLKLQKIPEPLNPNNKNFQLAIKIWRLLPLGITRIIGMNLRKQIGI